MGKEEDLTFPKPSKKFRIFSIREYFAKHYDEDAFFIVLLTQCRSILTRIYNVII